MSKISQDIIQFFFNQGYAIASTIDKNGYAHSACKDIVEINPDGRVYLFDLYHSVTDANLQRNPHITITAVDEHKFKGYCLKGKVKTVPKGEFPEHLKKAWEARIASRLTNRLIKNLRDEKGHPAHPEASLPDPKYLIAMDVEEIVDLTPKHLK